MPIELMNESEGLRLIDNNTIEMDKRHLSGIILFMNYAKGAEEGVKITHASRDGGDESGNYYDIVYRDTSGILQQFFVELRATGKYVHLVATEFCSETARVNFEFFNNTGSEGTLQIYAKQNSHFA